MSAEAPQMPPYDDAGAAALIGKRVLIGVTSLDHTGGLIGQWQFYGEVAHVSREEGITVVLEGNRDGETYVLPPCTTAFKPAAEGIYTLRSTSESVENPDYTVQLTYQEPDPGESRGASYRFDE